MPNMLQKMRRYYLDYGTKKFVIRIFEKLTFADRENYEKWLKIHLPSKSILKAQRARQFEYRPKISIVVPLYKTPENYFKEMVASVTAQSYENWELLLSDGSGEDTPIPSYLTQTMKDDPRIVYFDNRKQCSIVENSNIALEKATGDYVTLLDHDDLLTPDALYSCVRVINKYPETDMLYSDEDKVTMDGKHFFQPHFKTDYNIDLLCSVNYICHLFMAKRSLIEEAGPFREEYNGAQDYDMILRCAEKAKRICHIPRILYHWRAHQDSTSENPESKRYAFEAGARAVQAHYDRLGIPAEVAMGEYPGLYHTSYLWEEKPLISILIPNKDHVKDLRQCLDSLKDPCDYPNYEVIIIENNSEEEETFRFYEEIQKEDERIRIVTYDGGFNFSAINNLGASYAKGDYLLFLNNDTKMLRKDCLWQLVSVCMRDDVGAVGARLYYEDGSIQHAGVIIGFGGIAGHAFVGEPHDRIGYFARIIVAQDLNAVTAACMIMKKSVFEEVGGFDEEIAVAFNDTDLCLKARKAGYLVVYNPACEVCHYESKSRGTEDSPEKIRRFQSEVEMFRKRWPHVDDRIDPYYNPNMSMRRRDFGVKTRWERDADKKKKKELEKRAKAFLKEVSQ